VKYVWILLSLIPSLCFATTPAVTNVTGTVSAGQTLTITGTTMMDLATTNWLDTSEHASFEAASALADAYSYNADNWTWFGGGTGTIAYDSTAVHGSHSVKIVNSSNCPEDSQSCGHITLYQDSDTWGGAQGDIYLSGYVRYDWSDYPSQYLKFLLSDGPQQFYFQPIIGSSNPLTGFRYQHGSGLSGGVTVDNGSLEWHHWEVRFKRSNPARYSIWWDGVEKLDSTDLTDSGTIAAMEWGTPNVSGQTSTSLTMWMDAQVISTSRIYPWTKVEICDSATYSGATCVTQTLQTIGDTETLVTADLSGLSEPYYLFVTNNKQETSSAYNLSGEEPPAATATHTGVSFNGVSIQ
jgi:hypothetical protein